MRRFFSHWMLSQRIAHRFLHSRSSPPRHWQWIGWLITLLGTCTAGYVFFLHQPHSMALGLATFFMTLASCTIGLLLLTSIFTSVAVLGIALGVAALFTVHAVTSGFSLRVEQLAKGMQADLSLPWDHNTTSFSKEMWEADRKQISQHPSVQAVATTFSTQGLLISPNGTTAGVLIKGIDPEHAAQVGKLAQWLLPFQKDPSPHLLPSHPSEALLGDSLAQRLGLNTGDTFSLLFSYQTTLQQDSSPALQNFTVAGRFHSGFSEYDQRVICLPNAALSFLPATLVTPGFEIRLKPHHPPEEVGAQLVKELQGRYHYQTWKEVDPILLANIAQAKSVLTLVLYLIMFAAIFNTIATVTIVIKRKRPEISLLRALGLPRSSIAQVFRGVGLWIGIYGILIGIGIGTLLCFLLKAYQFRLQASIYKLEHLPIVMQNSDALWLGCTTLMLCLVAILRPSQRAANIPLIEGLHRE